MEDETEGFRGALNRWTSFASDPVDAVDVEGAADDPEGLRACSAPVDNGDGPGSDPLR
jgi:hypothetical protein